MSVVTAVLLAGLVLLSLLCALALVRVRTPFERLHAVGLLNLAGGALLVAAVAAEEGLGATAFKVLLIWLTLAVPGAVATHTIGRAIHLRDGERR